MTPSLRAKATRAFFVLRQEGRRIHRVPGMPRYDRTRPEEVFRTEAEAGRPATGGRSCGGN